MICDNPTIGVLYDVTFQDCCVEGLFRAALTGMTYFPDDIMDTEPDTITFSNGVIFLNHYHVKMTRVPQ